MISYVDKVVLNTVCVCCVCVCVLQCVILGILSSPMLCIFYLGDVESTMPTKLLMETAAYIDTHSPELKEWFLNCKEEILANLDATEIDISTEKLCHE